jgi:hypothetical protein
MDITELLIWLESLSLASAIRESRYIFPFIESLHVVGLAMVFGTIAIIDLRLLGLASMRRSFKRMASDILKWTWMAFALTAVTGAIMFITNAQVYYHNFYFRSKMLLLVLSAVNMMIFEFTAGRTVREWDKEATTPTGARVAGAASLALWIGVIFLGRWIGFSTANVNLDVQPEINLDELFSSPLEESPAEETLPPETPPAEAPPSGP